MVRSLPIVLSWISGAIASTVMISLPAFSLEGAPSSPASDQRQAPVTHLAPFSTPPSTGSILPVSLPEHSSYSSRLLAQALATTVTYTEPSGLFEISFPEGYSYEETGTGIVFLSPDQQFGGSVDFGAANGIQLTNDQLEVALKEEYEERLTGVEWQGTSIQADGSVRVDWIGTDSQGNILDSISFVEQRGDTIFILNLHGINAQYANYNTVAQAIVNTYRVAQGAIVPYPASARDSFISECALSAIDSGATDIQAEEYCLCALTEIERVYTFEEFSVIDAQIGQGQPAPAAFERIAAFCVEQTLSN